MAPVILYEDNHCLALCKPAGLLTQGAAGVPSLEGSPATTSARSTQEGPRLPRHTPPPRPARLRRRPLRAEQQGGSPARRAVRPAPGDEGVLGAVERSLRGDFRRPSGGWEDCLLKIPEQSRSEVSRPRRPGAKHALLAYRVLSSAGDEALLEITPHTGRMHQIRVQASSRGWPDPRR